MIIPDNAPEYVSFDPGGAARQTTGASEWSAEGQFTFVGQMNVSELDRYLLSLKERGMPSEFFIEDYRLWKARNRGGSRLVTAKVIGQLEYFARQNAVKITFCSPTNLKIAAMWAGVEWPQKSHSNSHWIASYLHGYYTLHKRGIIPPRVLEG